MVPVGLKERDDGLALSVADFVEIGPKVRACRGQSRPYGGRRRNSDSVGGVGPGTLLTKGSRIHVTCAVLSLYPASSGLKVRMLLKKYVKSEGTVQSSNVPTR